ncbi:penicillin-binding protein 1C, partial [Corallococcus exiguus]|nr:penicillin-binding protein 1C [Corallococcus exiguus]
MTDVENSNARRRIRRTAVAACIGMILAVPLVSLWRFVDRLGALDLSMAEDRSTIVLDRHGTLLRPFVTREGRWRLPIERGDVDPHFIAMLKAYEDARFESHFGIDLLALLRAA